MDISKLIDPRLAMRLADKLCLTLLILGLFAQINYAQKTEKNKTWVYPAIKPDTAIEYYFGKKIIDPFRNLENSENKAVKAWLKAQNELYDSIIHNISNRDTLDKELKDQQKRRKKWADYPRVADNRFFYATGFYNDNEIERIVCTDGSNQIPVELFSTKEFNKRDSVVYTINYYEPSYDGKYIAFGISHNGNERASIFIIDVEKRQLLPEKIQWSRAGNIQWLPDGTSFFYIKDKVIVTEDDKKAPDEDPKVYLHKLYTDSKYDREIFSRVLNKGLDLKKIDWPMLFVFPSSDKVILNIVNSMYNSAYYASLGDVLNKPSETIKWIKICGEDEKLKNCVLYGNSFIGLSFKQNPNGQLIMLNLSDLKTKVIYEATDFLLDDIVLTKNYLYLTTIEKGLNKLVRINLANYHAENIELPFLGGMYLSNPRIVSSCYQNNARLMFTLTNYNKQWGVFICDENKKVFKTDIFPETQYNAPLDLIVEEIEVPSHDGVMVPLSIIYKKSIKLDGNNPTIISAYGAFGNIEKPEFARTRLPWFNHGGIFAVAHVRGGGEKGDKWYKGGFKATKPNSWKDLISCANYLIRNNYTSPQNLAIMGYSAGGVTIGRAITERPDLFKAAVIYAGTMNPVRMENSFNTSTVTEFGTMKDSLESQYLYNMDPYHHIKEGIKYPSVLFTASLNDSRVPTWQPAKAVAKMQEASKGRDNIVLFRIEDKGHFDYPSDADVYSFLFWQLGHPDFKLRTSPIH